MEDELPDVPETAGLASQLQQNHGQLVNEQELDEKYPNRPRNFAPALPFNQLFTTLFEPLLQNKKQPTRAVIARKKTGPNGPSNVSPGEARRQIIERFISRWRKEVGNDIFPAFRLIIPDRDRERSMYGLKEKTIGKLLVKILRIDKNSEDGYNLLNWKLPGVKATSSSAGDFAGRCYEVLRKRSLRSNFGDMTIDEVNEKLDALSLAGKEAEQQPILEEFYNRMNADEMLWLIRIILRQMKIGATEKTFFDVWHSDAETLFNISSNLRRVCWELYDPETRLVGDNAEVALMSCFQPQLAQFQMQNMEKMVIKMRPTETDNVFWIEEKLDGERMQLHMIEDETIAGGKRFGFWSRKAKDYTYLYGSGFYDDNSALTRHLKEAFHEDVRNIILDGEMITWDPTEDKIVAFGTLKTAALSEQKNPFGTGQRPLYRVFDILLLNDKDITQYTLRDRRRALNSVVKPVHRRMEIHDYTEATTAAEVEEQLRKVVAETSEGLVLKNPRSAYKLNQRNDDWMKVKPEYMTEFGEALDCVVIGGYYGSGSRGGGLSSFLCGLRDDVDPNAGPMKFWSFFKVGGGFSASDYATIRHQTDGKWQDYDPKRPPREYIELGPPNGLGEKPDVWIKPDDSFVIAVKAASVGGANTFRMGYTLRFPRFKSMRSDKNWQTALSVTEWMQLKANVEKEKEQKQFEIDDAKKKKRMTRQRKKPLTVAGAAVEPVQFLDNDFSTNVFSGLSFFIMSPSDKPVKKEKTELEAIVKHHGGAIYQSDTAASNIICISDRRVVKAVSLQRRGEKSIYRPIWLFDCIDQAKKDAAIAGDAFVPLPLPFEYARHVFSAAQHDEDMLIPDVAQVLGQPHTAVDEYLDSFARDIGSIDELRNILDEMPKKFEEAFDREQFVERLEEEGFEREGLSGWLFQGCVAWFDNQAGDVVKNEDDMDLDGNSLDHELSLDLAMARCTFQFGDGVLATGIDQDGLTHIVISSSNHAGERAKELRRSMQRTTRLPRIVTEKWIQLSWAERTLLDEERFAVS